MRILSNNPQRLRQFLDKAHPKGAGRWETDIGDLEKVGKPQAR
jgi:hypothetical protein